MNGLMQWIWQFNLEVSLLLAFILIARAGLRMFMRSYNNYLLWFSVPLAVLVAKFLSAIEISTPVVTQAVSHARPIQSAVQYYITQPSNAFDAWLIAGAIAALLSLLLLARLAHQHWKLRRELELISNGETLKINASFPVVEVIKDGFSPAVYGFIKPTIYFPAGLINSLSQHQLELIVRHEEPVSYTHLTLPTILLV